MQMEISHISILSASLYFTLTDIMLDKAMLPNLYYKKGMCYRH